MTKTRIQVLAALAGALLCVMWAVLSVRAQDGSGGGASDGGRAPDRRMGPGIGPGGPGPGGAPPPWWRGGRGGWRPNPEEWNEISGFMKQYCPKRWEVYQKLPPDKQEPLQLIVSRRWRLMQWVKNSDPELYDLQRDRWRTEDEIFGLTQDLKAASSSAETPVRKKLHDKIGELVDLRIKERNMRVARWEKMIAQERELIARETRDREEIVRNRMRVAERDAGNLGDEEQPEATTQESADGKAVSGAATTAPAPGK